MAIAQMVLANAAAALTVLALTGTSLAELITRPVNSVMTRSGSFGSLIQDVDIDLNGTPDLTFELFWEAGSFWNYSAIPHGMSFVRLDGTPTPTFPARLEVGSVVSGASLLTQQAILALLNNTTQAHSGNWYDFIGTGYLGFSLPTGDGIHYGWFRIGTDQTTWAVYDLGLETTPGTPVVIPAPAVLASLLAGAGLHCFGPTRIAKRSARATACRASRESRLR